MTYYVTHASKPRYRVIIEEQNGCFNSRNYLKMESGEMVAGRMDKSHKTLCGAILWATRTIGCWSGDVGASVIVRDETIIHLDKLSTKA